MTFRHTNVIPFIVLGLGFHVFEYRDKTHEGK